MHIKFDKNWICVALGMFEISLEGFKHLAGFFWQKSVIQIYYSNLLSKSVIQICYPNLFLKSITEIIIALDSLILNFFVIAFSHSHFWI